MKVVVAPDGFGGSLSPREAADAIAAGWRRQRPGDAVVAVPMSDGGEGLLAAVREPGDTWLRVEVAGPLGHPVDAGLLVRRDGTAIVESALACGIALVPPERRSPLLTTTYGVGQLLEAARRRGVPRVLVGVGGSASVEGGAGALTALGFRPRVGDGSGLKIGGEDLDRVASIEHGWSGSFADIDVEVLADVAIPLLEAPARFGPQKGAGEQDVARLTRALKIWAEAVEHGLEVDPRLREQPGAGAAGGLAYGLAAGVGARIVPGARRVARLLRLEDAMSDAAIVVTGEGRLDATSGDGKVVDHVRELALRAGAEVLAVVGQSTGQGPSFSDLEAASPSGPGPDPAGDVARAAARLAARVDHGETAG